MSQNMEINNSVYTSSIDPSLFQSVTDQAQLNSIIKNMTTDTLDRPIKYSKPKYLQVEKTYKELAPITNKTIQMPTKQSNKIRTLDTVYQQPIVLGENASASVIFKGNEYEQNIPLPTNSVINNLIKDSVMQSNINQDYQDFQQIYNQDFQSNIQPPIQSNIQPPIQSNIQSQMQSNIQSQMQPNIQSQMQPNIQSQMQPNIQSQVKSNIKPEMQSNIQSQMQMKQSSKYKSKIGRTKYEEDLLREDQMKSIKNSSGMNKSNNQKTSAIPPPYEGEGLVFSTQFDNNMKSTMNNNINKQSNINNTNMLNSQQSHHNQSKLSSKISQANNPQYQQSINSIKNFPQSQMQMQQSNMNNQSMKQSNVPPRQSGVQVINFSNQRNYQKNQIFLQILKFNLKCNNQI